MRLRILAILVLTTSVVAGCSSAPEQGPFETAAIVTNPADYAYLENSSSDGSHIHDYWQGRSSVQVIQTWQVTGMECTGCNDPRPFLMVRPPSGNIVPQGASHVMIKFRWEETTQGRHGPIDLWVKTANESETRRVGEVVSDQVVNFTSSQPQNDPPHYVLSLWAFELRAHPVDGGDTVAFQGNVTIEATAVRGLPLVAYPAHPDRWNGATSLTVLEASGSVGLQTEQPGEMNCYNGCLAPFHPNDGRVVPWEARNVVATFDFGLATLPTGFGMAYHGADTWEAATPTGRREGANRLVFEIPTQILKNDSPYAIQSLWEFTPFLDQPGDVRVWSGSFTLTVVAQR